MADGDVDITNYLHNRVQKFLISKSITFKAEVLYTKSNKPRGFYPMFVGQKLTLNLDFHNVPKQLPATFVGYLDGALIFRVAGSSECIRVSEKEFLEKNNKPS